MCIIFVFHCILSWNYRVHIARWCAESNCAAKIVTDCQFDILMKAGHPGTSLPSPMTVSCDIKATFEKCCKHIDNILKVHLLPHHWLLTYAALFRPCPFHNRCIDISKSLCICCLDSTSPPPGTYPCISARYHWGSGGMLYIESFLDSATNEFVLVPHWQYSWSGIP